MRLPLLFLAVIEGIIFAASYHASIYLRLWSIGLGTGPELFDLLNHSVFVALIFVLTMGAMGLYESGLREGLTGSLIRIVISLLITSFVLAAITFFYPLQVFWRSILLLTICISFIGVMAVRLIVFSINPEIFMRSVIMLSDSPLAAAPLLEKHKGLRVVGLIPTTPSLFAEDDIKIIPYDRPLLQIISETNGDEIVLAFKDRRGKLPLEDLLDCRMAGIQVLGPLEYFEREFGVIKLDLLRPSWLIQSDGFQNGSVKIVVKRLFDMCVSLLFLVTLWPIMLVTAIAISIESGFRQPIFYRQIRVGENGMPFEVIKFRSMRIDAESDGTARWASKNDPRITRVGNLIRKTRIDELPQILNVLKGDMSFVGPRPERPEFVAVLAKKYDYYAARHHLKPGLTGWAQIRYPYGNTEEDALKKLEYDLYYIKNQSTFLDLLILMETVEVVLFGKGAM